MSRKDYEVIAAAFAVTAPENGTPERGQWGNDVRAVADALALTNPRFNGTTFFRACGLYPKGN